MARHLPSAALATLLACSGPAATPQPAPRPETPPTPPAAAPVVAPPAPATPADQPATAPTPTPSPPVAAADPALPPPPEGTNPAVPSTSPPPTELPPPTPGDPATLAFPAPLTITGDLTVAWEQVLQPATSIALAPVHDGVLASVDGTPHELDPAGQLVANPKIFAERDLKLDMISGQWSADAWYIFKKRDKDDVVTAIQIRRWRTHQRWVAQPLDPADPQSVNLLDLGEPKDMRWGGYSGWLLLRTDPPSSEGTTALTFSRIAGKRPPPEPFVLERGEPVDFTELGDGRLLLLAREPGVSDTLQVRCPATSRVCKATTTWPLPQRTAEGTELNSTLSDWWALRKTRGTATAALETAAGAVLIDLTADTATLAGLLPNDTIRHLFGAPDGGLWLLLAATPAHPPKLLRRAPAGEWTNVPLPEPVTRGACVTASLTAAVSTDALWLALDCAEHRALYRTPLTPAG